MGDAKPVGDKRPGKRLRSLRAARRIRSGETVAQDLKVSYRNYQRWENGWATPQPVNQAKLADYFEVTVEDLMGWTPAAANGVEEDELITRLERIEGMVIELLAAQGLDAVARELREGDDEDDTGTGESESP